MADGIFLRRRGLGCGKAAQIVGDEEGVVAEAVFAARRVRDAPLAAAARDQLAAVGQEQDDSAGETRGSLFVRHAFQLVQQLRVVVGIACILAGIPARPHAGPPGQGVHLQAAVVGKRRQARVRKRGTGLDARVALERVGVFDGLGEIAELA